MRKYGIIAICTVVAAFPTPSEGGSAKDVFAKVSSSVVVVLASDVDGQGSGVHVGTNRVVTNCHVISGAKKIAVRQAIGKRGSRSYRMAANLTARNEVRDLCLLSVEGISVPLPAKPVPLGDARDVSVGEEVYAIGAPHGLELSLSRGIVSQLRGAYGERSASIIQTDAAISPGSSGGGLFNGRAELIGITTFKFSGSTSEGLSFAVPAEWVRELIEAEREWLACSSSPTSSCLILEALKIAETARNADHRASALSGISRSQAEAGDIAGALKSARQISDVSTRALALVEIARSEAAEEDEKWAKVTLSEALRTVERMETGYPRFLALTTIAEMQAAAGNRPNAATTLAAALRVAEKMDDGTSLALALSQISRSQAKSGDIVGALKTIKKIDDERWVASALSGVAQARASAGDITGALQTAKQVNNEFSLASTLSDIGRAQAETGDIIGAKNTFAEALRAAVQADTAYSRVVALTTVARSQAAAKDIIGAKNTLAKALQGTKQIASSYWLSSALSRVAEVQAVANDDPGAQETLSEAVKVTGQIVDAEKRGRVLNRIARAQAETGDTAGAIATAKRIDQSFRHAVALADVGAAISKGK